MPVQSTAPVQGEPSTMAVARQSDPMDAFTHPASQARIFAELAHATKRAHLAIVDMWTGRHAAALCAALRLTNEGFAEHLGTAVRTVANWNAHPDMTPGMELQGVLDTALAQAHEDAQIRFALLLGRLPAVNPNPSPPADKPQKAIQPPHDTPERRAQVTALLVRLMTEQDISLIKLARRTHFDKGYLSKIKNGLKPLSPKVATALDEALGTDGQFTALASPQNLHAIEFGGER